MRLSNLKNRFLRLLPLQPFRREEIVFPLYHVVSDAPLPHVRNIYAYPDTKRFRRDLDLLLRHFAPAGLSEVRDAVSGKSPRRPSFHLSFDDGFRECYDVIAPILREKGVPATFFVCPGFIDNKEMFFRNKVSLLLERTRGGLNRDADCGVERLFRSAGLDYAGFNASLNRVPHRHAALVDQVAEFLGVDIPGYLAEQRPYLSSDQVRRLIEGGFAIGSHSTDHPLFSELTLEEQVEQAAGSLRLLQEAFGAQCRTFAFPHNDRGVSLSFYRQTGRDIDLYFGTGRMVQDCVPTSVQRFSLEDAGMECAEILKQNYLLRAYRSLQGKNGVVRKP